MQKFRSQNRVLFFTQICVYDVGVVLQRRKTLLLALLILLDDLLFAPFCHVEHFQTQEYVTDLYLKAVGKTQKGRQLQTKFAEHAELKP